MPARCGRSASAAHLCAAAPHSAYQVDYTAVNCGRIVPASKRRVCFKFGHTNVAALTAGRTGQDCRGSEHEVAVTWSLSSGKQSIAVDGREILYNVGDSTQTKLAHAWEDLRRGEKHLFEVKIHAANMSSKAQPGPNWRQYDLLVDGVSFFNMPKIFEIGVYPTDEAAALAPGPHLIRCSSGASSDVEASPGALPPGEPGEPEPEPAEAVDLLSFDEVDPAPPPAPAAPVQTAAHAQLFHGATPAPVHSHALVPAPAPTHRYPGGGNCISPGQIPSSIDLHASYPAPVTPPSSSPPLVSAPAPTMDDLFGVTTVAPATKDTGGASLGWSQGSAGHPNQQVVNPCNSYTSAPSYPQQGTPCHDFAAQPLQPQPHHGTGLHPATTMPGFGYH